MPEVVLVRHGETEWSLSGKHTSRTDLPLTDNGRQQAARVLSLFKGRSFANALTSPMARARETAAIAGYPHARVVDDLREWDYGDYEGRTTAEIRADRPAWSLWTDGCPDGETVADVAHRADAVIATLRDMTGDAIVFGHGHMLRVLAARWCGLAPEVGAVLVLATGTLSVLGYEREVAAIRSWNCH